MARIKELFEMYEGVDEEKLFSNLVYLDVYKRHLCSFHRIFLKKSHFPHQLLL